jgi:uncharacterized damage-inducible protein DinB
VPFGIYNLNNSLILLSTVYFCCMKDYLLQLLDYNRWANDRLFALIDESIVDREIPSSFNTLRKTVYHIWGAEELWLKRVQGDSAPVWQSQHFDGSFSEALSAMKSNNEAWTKLIESKSDTELQAAINYKNVAGTAFSNRLDHIVAHVCNHSTFHRGQIVTMLRSVGATEIPQTDLIAYFRGKTK